MKKEITLLVIQGDAFLQNKASSIIQYLVDNDIDILEFEFKHKFSEAEKEQMYVANLNSGRNIWWFSKDTFELGSCLALLVSTTTEGQESIFEKTTKLKGKSNPHESEVGTIRKDLDGLCTAFNLLHCSDCIEEFERESSVFFSKERIDKVFKKESSVNILNIFTEIKLTYVDYSSKNSCINTLLFKIYHCLITFCRNNNYDNYDYKQLNKLIEMNDYNYTINELVLFCNILKNNLEVNKKTIDIITLCIYTLEILNNDDKTFIWEKFLKVLDLNMIKVPAEINTIMIGILKYEQI